jgi:Holliday junction resolvase
VSSRGHDRERAVKKVLEAEGWVVLRAPGSLGTFDLVAMRGKIEELDPRRSRVIPELRLIEVKSTAQGPYEHFGPEDRAELLAAAERAGGVAELAYWPSRGKLRWIKSSEWPQ